MRIVNSGETVQSTIPIDLECKQTACLICFPNRILNPWKIKITKRKALYDFYVPWEFNAICRSILGHSEYFPEYSEISRSD